MKNNCFLSILLLLCLCLPANSAQQYIQKVHEQQKQQAAHKTQVNKAANTSKPNIFSYRNQKTFQLKVLYLLWFNPI